jgi:hypothetical protein
MGAKRPGDSLREKEIEMASKTIIEEELAKLGWTFNEASAQWENEDPLRTESRIDFIDDLSTAVPKALMRLERILG